MKNTMHKVYFGKRCIRLRTDAAYRLLCLFFKEVSAAGGLVTDSCGRFLFIRRNGFWDLPKGHREQGEEIEATALREVMEETGLKELVLGELICVTDHTYKRDGRRHLKHTWWYAMDCPAGQETVPQNEEGIDEVAWVGAAETGKYVDGAYPSIKEVFNCLKA